MPSSKRRYTMIHTKIFDYSIIENVLNGKFSPLTDKCAVFILTDVNGTIDGAIICFFDENKDIVNEPIQLDKNTAQDLTLNLLSNKLLIGL